MRVGSTEEGVISISQSLSPVARNLASSLHLSDCVTPQELGNVVQRTIRWLGVGHALLDAGEEEAEDRLSVAHEERTEWELLGAVMREHREILSLERLQHDRRRELAEAAIRKFYDKALEGEALFREMLEKQRNISKTKYEGMASSSSDSIEY